MPKLEDSTLWRISAFERMRAHTPDSSSMSLSGPTLLPTTLLAELRRLQADPVNDDVLEVVAACLRHQEPALLYLQAGPLVWPVTLFPIQRLYHSPRDAAELQARIGLSTLKLLSAERPGVRPPGHFMHERVAGGDKYRPLGPLFWAIAIYGPRGSLLGEIGGRAAYRLAPGHQDDLFLAPGALGHAAQRLRTEATSLRDMARWPGLSVERASRLLNALYLSGSLIVMRNHRAARDEPAGGWRQLLSRRR